MVEILKRNGWKCVKVCEKCESTLEAYPEDVMSMPKHDSSGTFLGQVYWFSCPVCRNYIYLDYEKDKLNELKK